MQLAFVIIFIILASPSYAAMYKWTDEQGNTHYGEQPPNRENAQNITPPPPRASTEGSSLKRIQSLREGILTQAADSKKNKAELKEKALKEEKKSKYCDQLRKRLSDFQSFPRIRQKGEDGEYRFIDSTKKQKQEKEMQQRLAKDCS